MTDGLKAPLSIILVQNLTTVMLLLSKVVLNRGIFVFALLAYRNVIGAGFVAPFAFFLERDMWKNLDWKGIMWIFINALFGALKISGPALNFPVPLFGYILPCMSTLLSNTLREMLYTILPDEMNNRI